MIVFFCNSTLSPRQNGCHFADVILKFTNLYENCCSVETPYNWISGTSICDCVIG